MIAISRERQGVNVLFLLICILSFTAIGRAATVTGTVTGPDGEPFRAAFVEAQNLKTHITVIVLSDKTGRYHIENLPSGEYDVSIKALGYKADPHTGIDLTTAPAATAQFALHKSAVLWTRPVHLPRRGVAARSAGQKSDADGRDKSDSRCPLPDLPFVPKQDGSFCKRRRWLAHPRGVHEECDPLLRFR